MSPPPQCTMFSLLQSNIVLWSIKSQVYLHLNGALGNTGKQDAGAASYAYSTQSSGWFSGLHNLFQIKIKSDFT